MSSALSWFKNLFASKPVLIAVILIISVGVYFNTLFNEFTSDDEWQILKNPWIKDLKYLPNIFFSNIWAFDKEGISNYYRPVIHVIYTAVYHIFGLNPLAFHLTYAFFHAGAAVLVFFVASALACRESFAWPAIAASLLFATHPINTEAVNLGGPDPFFAFFYLLSFYLYATSNAIWSKGFILSIVFFFVSALCKETALTLPILLFAYDYSFKKEPALYLWPKTFKTFYLLMGRYIPYLFAAGIYFGMRIYAIGSFAPSKNHQDLSIYQCLINIFPLFAQYIEKLILPVNLNYFYVLHPIYSIFEWKGLAAIGLTILFVFIAYLFRKSSVVFFSLLWIAIPLLPVFYIPVLGDNTFAERYLYLPSVGFVILISLIMERAYELRMFGRITGVMVVSFVIILTMVYSIGTVKRNFIWKDNYTLWTDTVEKSPDGAVPHYNKGVASQDRGLTDKAMEDYSMALYINPNYSKAYNNRGLAYADKGQYDKAIEDYNKAILLKPNPAKPYNNRGLAYYNKGQYDKAIEDFNMAIAINPNLAQAYNNRGNAYINKGQYDKAVEDFNKTVALDPKHGQAYNNRGLAYADKGQYDKAIEDFNMAIALTPNLDKAYNNRGLAYYNKGQYDKAIEDYNMAIKINSDYTEAYYYRGVASANKGRYDKAIEDFNKAIALDRNNASVYAGRGLAYFLSGNTGGAVSDWQKACNMGNSLACDELRKASRKK